MKRILAILSLVIVTSFVIHAQQPQLINVGIPVKSFDATATSVANGTAFALPAIASQCTWITGFGSAPASITILLQTSLDNITYNTLDTSTSTAGETRNVTSAATFIRARISASSGGTLATVSIICKNGIVSTSLSPTFTNLTVTGTTTLNNITITGTCTGCGGGGGVTWPLSVNGHPIIDGISDDTNSSEDAFLIKPTTGQQVSIVLASDYTDTNTWKGLFITSASMGGDPNVTIESMTNGSSAGNITLIGGASSLVRIDKEIDITAASGPSGTTAGSPIVLTAGDGSTSGAGGTISLLAGGSGSGTAGDIILQSSDFIQLAGPVLFPGNGSVATGKTIGNSLILRAYDVDGATYKTFLTLTSANVPDLTISPAAGSTITLQATTYKSADGTTGATVTNCTGFKNGLCISGT